MEKRAPMLNLILFLLLTDLGEAGRINIRSLGVGFTDFCRRFVFARDCRGIQSKRGDERMEDGKYFLGLFLPLPNTLAGFQQVKAARFGKVMDAPDDDPIFSEDNSLLVARPRRALENVEDGKVLFESPLDLDKPEIISQMVPRDNGHPWAPALLETKMKTFENQPTMSNAIQPTFFPLKDHFGQAIGHLRGLRPNPPEAPWGLVVPSSSSSFSPSGKRTGIFNYRFIRI